MSALPKDEFALEMRTHFLETTLGLVTALKTDPAFPQRFIELCEDWKGECISNDLPFLAGELEKTSGKWKLSLPSERGMFDCAERFVAYLTALKSSEDKAELALKYADSQPSFLIEESSDYLQCRFGRQAFLIPVENVVEISQRKKINLLPLTDQRIKGLVAFRGVGTPVFCLDLGPQEPSTDNSYFVICEFETQFFAIEVHGTDEVCRIKKQEFQNSSTENSDKFFNRGDKILLLLDIAKLVKA